MEGEREVSIEDGYAKGRKFDALFVESSAKTGHGIQDLFRNVTSILLSGGVDPSDGVNNVVGEGDKDMGETLAKNKVGEETETKKKNKWYTKC